jgi:hypothetical protein
MLSAAEPHTEPPAQAVAQVELAPSPTPVPNGNTGPMMAVSHSGGYVLGPGGCEPCPPRCVFSAGATAYFLRPYFDNSPAFIRTTGIGTPAPVEESPEFEWDYNVSPAFWLAWTSASGWGIRGRYFHFDESANTLGATLTPAEAATTTIRPPAGLVFGGLGVPPNFGSPGLILAAGMGQDVMTFNSDLRIQVIDVEATYDIRSGPWSLQLAGGGRYMNLEQSYAATLTNAAANGMGGTATETNLLTFARDFNGGGPTVALQANLQIMQSNLSVYGNVRGSLLVGRESSDLALNQSLVNDPGFLYGGDQVATPTSSRSRDRVLPVAEVELGLEYGMNMGRFRSFIRGAVVNQTYFEGGSASQSEGNLSLFGGQITLGVGF